jgi:hypothetical protein
MTFLRRERESFELKRKKMKNGCVSAECMFGDLKVKIIFRP